MPSLSYSLKTKGFKKTFNRVGSLVARYGLSSSRMEKNIIDFINFIERYDARATFPITAKTLEHHADFIKGLQNQRIEYAIHGYTHVDYSKLNAEYQNKDIKEAIAVFKKCGITPYGFRGPYLQSNEDTLKALKENGLIYDSSTAIHGSVVPEEFLKKEDHSYNLALKLYRSNSSKSLPKPYIVDGLVRIPVSLPDDEMLIDRLNIRNQKLLAGIWSKLLYRSNEQGSVFVLQLHPERIQLALDSLGILLEESTKMDIWVTSLKELSTYWMNKKSIPDNYKSVFCITGDIDIISLGDYWLRKR